MRFRTFLIIASVLFIAGIIFGLFLPEDTFSSELEGLEELVASLDDASPLSIFFYILYQNSFAITLSFLFAPLLLLAPVASLVTNGVVIGIVSAIVVQEQSLGYLLAGLLPHGILELPAFIIAEAAALSFGAAAIMAVISRQHRPQLIPQFKKSGRYFLLATALLVPAALIETFITPLFL